VIALLALLALMFPTPGAAGQPHKMPMEAEVLLKRADAAYSDDDRVRAQRLYRAVLVYDPDNTRAIFQLSRLEPKGSPGAVELLRRYMAFEPNDLWGRMALGDALAKSGAIDSGIEQYRRARHQAPGESDVYRGLGRILHTAGRRDELIENYEAWVEQQPKNAEAWLELGRARQQARRYAEAADAYAQSQAIKQDNRTYALLEGVLAETAFSLRPYVGNSADSDKNSITRLGLDTEWQLTERSRLGLHAERANVSDLTATGTADEFALFAKWQPRSFVSLEGLAGVAQLQAPITAAGQNTSSHPLARLRFRWNSPANGPGMELRYVENPLVATPGLLAQPVELSEFKGAIEAPWFDAWRVRARGQSGLLKSATDTNNRTGYAFGPLYRLLPSAEIGVSYNELGYAHDAAAGYFAPQRVQTVELGTYIEYERLWPVVFTFDAGIGQQRFAKQGEAIGRWNPTYRLWAQISWTITPGVRLDLELEHSDSPLSGTAVAPASDWNSNSAILSLRFGVFPKRAQSFLDEHAPRLGGPPS
jgi:tetratricopeptide (TPR) repeat protein